MKERPILFSGPMVRAILEGRKTVTRRVFKDVTRLPPDPAGYSYNGHAFLRTEGAMLSVYPARCPYGAPGDRLWVREAHWWFVDQPDHETGYYPPKLTLDDVEYRADGEKPGRVWRPSIHMPRWASRITLEIMDERVERLTSISEADALAEGVWTAEAAHASGVINRSPGGGVLNHIGAYRRLWEEINGQGSWDANPWVWAITFRRIAQ